MSATRTFLGAAGTVTGSQHLLDDAARRLLLDSGLFLFQGLAALRDAITGDLGWSHRRGPGRAARGALSVAAPVVDVTLASRPARGLPPLSMGPTTRRA